MPPQFTGLPVDIKTAWETKFPRDSANPDEMSFEDFMRYSIQCNVASTNIEERKGTMVKKAIVQPEIAEAVNTLRGLTPHFPENLKDGQVVGGINALNKLADYRLKGGSDYLYFDHYQPSYPQVISYAGTPGGQYEKLKNAPEGHIDAAIIDKAVSAFIEKPENKKGGIVQLDQRLINEQREKIAGNPALMESLRQDQKNLENKFENPQEVERKLNELPAEPKSKDVGIGPQ